MTQRYYLEVDLAAIPTDVRAAVEAVCPPAKHQGDVWWQNLPQSTHIAKRVLVPYDGDPKHHAIAKLGTTRVRDRAATLDRCLPGPRQAVQWRQAYPAEAAEAPDPKVEVKP